MAVRTSWVGQIESVCMYTQRLITAHMYVHMYYIHCRTYYISVYTRRTHKLEHSLNDAFE